MVLSEKGRSPAQVLHVYQLLGGLLVALLEMDPDWLANMVQSPSLGAYAKTRGFLGWQLKC